MEISVGGERVVLTPGCLYVAAPGVPHGGSIFTGLLTGKKAAALRERLDTVAVAA